MDKRSMRRIAVNEDDYNRLVAAAAAMGFIPKVDNSRRDAAKEGVERLLSESLPCIEGLVKAGDR